MNEEIKIGDEIRAGIEGRNAFNVVVFLVGKRPDGVTVYQCMSSGGNHFIYTSEDNIRKTGKHYPHVEELQKAMQKAEENDETSYVKVLEELDKIINDIKSDINQIIAKNKGIRSVEAQERIKIAQQTLDIINKHTKKENNIY